MTADPRIELARTGDAEASEAIAREGHAWSARDGSPMVHIPAGPFLRGHERRRAHLPAFAMAMHPVTNAQYAAFLEATGYVPDSAHPLAERYLRHWGSAAERPPEALAQHPVVNVSWVDASHYCAWAGLVLPSSAEWEKAARGTDGRAYPWGDAKPQGKRFDYGTRWWVHTEKLAHIDEADVRAVGSAPERRTAFGCQDMIGNVSEICEPEGMPRLDPGTIDERLLETRIELRGSAYLRSSQERGRMTCMHGRRMRATGRTRWHGFRPAFRFG